jgi:hypothetical protein
VRPEETQDLRLAMRMAQIFHAEELRQQEAHQALWGEGSLFVDLTWDVLPWNTRAEKTEAMYAVIRYLNGDVARQLWRDEEDTSVVDIHAFVSRANSRLRHRDGKDKHGRPYQTARQGSLR